MPEQNNLQITLCASFVIDPLKDYLEYWCKELHIAVNLAITPYNQVFQQLLNPGSELNQNTGINVLFIRTEDWLRDQQEKAAADQIAFLDQTYELFVKVIHQSRNYNGIPFLTAIVPLSPGHLFSVETAAHISNLNKELHSLLKTIPRVYLLDLTEIAALYEVEEMFDTGADKIGHIAFTQEYYAATGTYLARKIRAFKTPPYKVIALDCDNTLWKGVCGEDGALNVIIDQQYAYLQEFVLAKYREGFLLVICSKNNEQDVWEVFDRHPYMKLKREHILAHRINWNPKPGNLVSLAKELNIGLDSFIFLDDSAFEAEQVVLGCPEVLSVTLPENTATFYSFLNHIWEFDLFQVTEEDVQRNTMYKAEKQRKGAQVNYADLNDFLRDLNIIVNLRSLQEADMDRAVQLTLRTNQFNLNGIRRTREEIVSYMHSGKTLHRIIDVKDRFGDYGIVGLLLAKENGDELVVDTFLLSCRVLGRNVEDMVLTELQNYCLGKGMNTVSINFRSTPKNQPFLEFLQRTAWIADHQTDTYKLLIKNKEHVIA